MGAYWTGTWAELIEFEVVFARIAASGDAHPEHIEALRERAVTMAAEHGVPAVVGARWVEAEFYEGQIAARR